MINSVQLKNFGPLTEIDWQNLGPINLVIGNNGCGKSFLLKAMYSAMRTLEDYRRGDNPESANDILTKKLYWTFETQKIGDLVARSSGAALSFSFKLDQKNLIYGFDKNAVSTIENLQNQIAPRIDNSIFLPAKEILSIHHIILKSRQQDKVFGFDDTYFDLALALQIEEVAFRLISESLREIQNLPSTPDYTDHSFSSALLEAKKILGDLIGGYVNYDKTTHRWYFKKEHEYFSMGATAEGIKKVAILDRLLSNNYLSEKSIVFIDEPESTLHPAAISIFLDIVGLLAKHGIQFFIASHSYTVVKKLFLLAQQQQFSIPVISKEGNNWLQSDLLHDMPDNPIIDESIRLYKEEVNLPS